MTSDAIYTHVRLHIYPDGGVARLRIYGRPNRDWSEMAAKGEQVDLAAMINGGVVVDWSDAHYGNPNAILAPVAGSIWAMAGKPAAVVNRAMNG